jgi:hypothetical protein
MTEDEYENWASGMFRELAADGDPKAQLVVDALDRGSTISGLMKRGIEATMMDIIEGRADPRQADTRIVRIMAENIAKEYGGWPRRQGESVVEGLRRGAAAGSRDAAAMLSILSERKPRLIA